MAEPIAQPTLGPYEGSALSREAADEQSIALIPIELRRLESRLFRQKWYDYRRLHPMVATHYFVHCYKRAHSAAVVKSFDAHGGPFRTGVKADWLEKRERLAFYRLRQQADSMGVPYPVFLRTAMDHYLDDTGWRRVPRPQHLGQGTAADAVYAEWQDLCRYRLQLPVDPFFTVAAFVGHPYQVECEAWLLEQAQQRENPKFAIAALVYNYQRVRERALGRLPARLREEVEIERQRATP